MKTARPCMVIATLAFLLFCAPSLAHAHEMWYQDMPSHWAYDYVRLLWEEEVADGYQGSGQLSWGGQQYVSSWSVFKPQDPCTRAQLAVMLAKAFRLAPQSSGPTFADVPPGYCICYNKAAYPYIEAAARKGLIRGTGYGCFLPGCAVTREEAISIIIRGLDIERFLATFDQRRALSVLGRFLDGTSVNTSLRKELAAATLLKVVYGYPDGTLRPSEHLRRSEAVALVARSCLIKATSSLPCFSPDGDGIEDSVVISVETLKNRAVLDYGLVIADAGSRPIREWYGWIGLVSSPAPSPTPWNGAGTGGTMCGDGLYLYAAWVRDRQGLIHWSAYKPLFIERPAIWAFVDPEVVAPGGSVELYACASGNPSSVLWKDAQRAMMPAPGGWSTGVPVAHVCDEGTYHLIVEARYPSSAVRQAVAAYTVVDPFPLSARIIPNPAYPGQLVAVCAETWSGVLSVEALFPWDSRPFKLSQTSEHTWALETTVPRDIVEGRYPVRVTATKVSRQKSIVVWLDIKRTPVADFVFSLVT